MTLKRKLIRDYVVARLGTAISPGVYPTSAQGRVYDSRILAHQARLEDATELPAINVYTLDDRVLEVICDPPLVYKMECALDVEVIVKANDTYAADLDTMCEQIMARIPYYLASNKDDRIVESCLYDRTEIAMIVDGEQPIAVAKIGYKCTYEQDEITIEDLDQIPNLETLSVEWDMYSPRNTDVDGPDGQIDKTDLVNLPQS
jgi:hypothetical protein